MIVILNLADSFRADSESTSLDERMNANMGGEKGTTIRSCVSISLSGECNAGVRVEDPLVV
jgi:hypothetical protein